MTGCDAIVIGSGPNGLTAALTLARASLSVLDQERENHHRKFMREAVFLTRALNCHPERERGTWVGGRRVHVAPPTQVPRYARDDRLFIDYQRVCSPAQPEVDRSS